MARTIADFHLHSKYSRATSPQMEVEALARWAKIKGINLLGTGDFTHPLYNASLKAHLEPTGTGLLRLKKGSPPGADDLHFLLTSEVSNVFREGGRLRKIHTLIFAPTFEVVDRINATLARFGNLSSDGRPTFGFPASDLVKIALDASPDCLLVPAHAWTPWFSVFGSHSGFDSIGDCYGTEARHIHAIETGLSSNPAMNWRLSALDRVVLLSNSDAHSPAKLGREANVFDLAALDYQEIRTVITEKDTERFLFTIEFYPEEGKYHYDGHRNCKVLLPPRETRAGGGRCPVCGKGLTVGVMHRVEDLADREEGFVPHRAIPGRHLVPLEEIIAEAYGVGTGTAAVTKEYERLIAAGGNEFRILLDMTPEELSSIMSPRLVEGVLRVREGRLTIVPGYDGVYGKVTIFGQEPSEGSRAQTEEPLPKEPHDQMDLF